ncbi:hypothetical protein JZ751_029837 [Albula glossodonta]|uniref:UDENN domain-containing protein n=1 Tax=Albula glossodonta TaxID=121402 RepID=A0A8T2N9T0_9TELE|nr:hypothetical protein JZ751_029837 [Albula glossodonta]
MEDDVIVLCSSPSLTVASITDASVESYWSALEDNERPSSVAASGLWDKLPPSSLGSCLGDTQFCFRFRQASGRKSSLACFLDHFDRDAPVCLKRDQGHYYGYVYFRQVRDKSLKRGYFQKSLVLISKLPYVMFFHSLLKLVAPEYFEKLEPCLEAACNDIDRWSTPYPGKILTLPIMGVVMKVRIPTCYDKPGTSQLVQSAQNDSLVSIVLPTIHEVDLFRCFCPVFFHIQMLWELVLLGEALVVMAPSPAESSDTVLALVSCISPLRYCSDFRPYFTIHDSEFKEYTTRTQAPGDGQTDEGCPAETSFGGPECNSAAVLPGAHSELHHSSGEVCGQPDAPAEEYLSLEEPSAAAALHSGRVHEEPGEGGTSAHLTAEGRLDRPTQAEREQLPVRPGTVAKLQSHIESVILSLPEDLQGILHKPPTP